MHRSGKSFGILSGASFRKYLDSRLAFYRMIGDPSAADAEKPRSNALQRDIWSQAIVGVREVGTNPLNTLVQASLNTMIDVSTARDSPQLRKRITKRIQQEQAKSRAEELFPKLVEHKGEMPAIKDKLPTIFHNKDNPPGKIHQIVHNALAGYRDTLQTKSATQQSRLSGLAAWERPAGSFANGRR